MGRWWLKKKNANLPTFNLRTEQTVFYWLGNSAIEESSRATEEKKYSLILTALSFSSFLCIHEAAIDALHSLLDRTGERTEAASYS